MSRTSFCIIAGLCCFCLLKFTHGADIEISLAESEKSDAPSKTFLMLPFMKSRPDIDGNIMGNEWKNAVETKKFMIPGTIKETALSTQAWIGFDAKNLYIAFRCKQTPEQKKHVPKVKEHDGEVFSDNSVEIFIWADQKDPFYFHLAVNSIGTAFEEKCGLDLVTGLKTNDSSGWNPNWKVKTATEDDFWSAEMEIPLSDLKIVPEGLRVARLNLCRKIVGEKNSYATWSYLPVLKFHAPEYFNLIVMDFNGSGNQDIDFSKLNGLGPLGLFYVKNRTNFLILPGIFEINLKTALPDIFFKNGKISLDVELSEAGGKSPRPLGSKSLKLNSSNPFTLKITGLTQGDYNLNLKVKGMDVLLDKNILLPVRNACSEPKLEGKTVLEDCTWKNSSNTSHIEKVPGTGLILQSEFKDPVLAFDPTPDETITCITDFQGKLFLGSCTKPAVTDTGSVFTYDPETDLWEKVFQVNEQGLIRMTVYNGKLYIPGYDANDGGWDLGNIYIYDGKNWIEKRTVPRAVHIYDLLGYKGKIYVSAGIFNPAPDGMSIEQAAAAHKIEVHGRILSSADEGQTWEEEYIAPGTNQNVGLMTVFQDKIILNSNGDIVTYDGNKWTPLNLNPNFLYVYTYAEKEEDTLLMGTPFGLCRYDGKTLITENGVCRYVRMIQNFNGKWVFSSYFSPGYNAYHGPGGTGYPGDKNYSFVEVIPPEFLFVPPWAVKLPLKELQKIFKNFQVKDMCVSSHIFKGRLYMGTHPNGQVFVFPVSEEGSFESLPQKLQNGRYRVWWHAATPPGTRVEFQVRTAPTEDQLKKIPFSGPDGKVDSYYTEQGNYFILKETGIFQYKAILKTENTSKTPYLKKFILTIE